MCATQSLGFVAGHMVHFVPVHQMKTVDGDCYLSSIDDYYDDYYVQ